MHDLRTTRRGVESATSQYRRCRSFFRDCRGVWRSKSISGRIKQPSESDQCSQSCRTMSGLPPRRSHANGDALWLVALRRYFGFAVLAHLTWAQLNPAEEAS